MGYRETRRLHMSVPKLAGKSNWTVWQPRVMSYLESLDKKFASIIVGTYRCPRMPEGEAVTDEQRAKAQDKINTFKAYDYRARIQLGNTLDQETGAQVQDLSGTKETWDKLNDLYAENEGAASDRCWAELSQMRYKTSGVKAPEFVRQYHILVWQCRLAGMHTSNQVQIANFVQAVGDPRFSAFFNNLDLDRSHCDTLDVIYASFLQFETEKKENKEPSLDVFGGSSAAVAGPSTATTPATNVKEKESPAPPKGSKNQQSSKQQSAPEKDSGPNNKKRPNQAQSTENRATETTKRARVETQGEASSTANRRVRDNSPLFVPQGEEDLEDEESIFGPRPSGDSQHFA